MIPQTWGCNVQPSGKERAVALLSTCKPEERVEASFRVHGAKLAEISFCLIFVLGGGSSQIYQEKALFFIPYEGGIWEMIYYYRDIFKQNPLVLCPDLLVASQGSIILASNMGLKEVRRQLYASCEMLL